MLTVEAIEHRALQAYQKAIDLMRDTSIFLEDEMLALPHMSKLFKTQLESSRLFDHPRQRNRDLELQSQTSSDESSSEDDDGFMRNGTDSVDSDEYLSDNLFDVSSSVCEGIRVFDSINPSLSKSYFLLISTMKRSIYVTAFER